MTTKHLDTFKDLDKQRCRLYNRLREGDSPNGADKELLTLMSAVCNNLRDASIDPTANNTTHELAAATHISLAKMVDMAYSSSCGDLFDSLLSYTGDTAPLIRDPDHEANLVSCDMCLRLMSRALGLPADVDRAAREALPRPAAFDATPKPHNNTSPLARFRDADAIPDTPSSAPIAQAVYYGSCSISSHRLGPRPCMIANAPNSDVMAIAAYDGDRQMDPFTCFYDLASVDGWAGTPKMHYINNGLLDVCYDIVVDPTRKLIWAVDDQRAKSFRYSLGSSRSQARLVRARHGQQLCGQLCMVWDASRSTLYAATRCEGYNDRTGRRERYREARARAGIHDHRGMQQPPPPQPVGEDDYLHDKAWPMQCAHDEKYFGYAWDCGEHRLIRYKFGLDADATVVPEYGDAYPSRGVGYSDW